MMSRLPTTNHIAERRSRGAGEGHHTGMLSLRPARNCRDNRPRDSQTELGLNDITTSRLLGWV